MVMVYISVYPVVITMRNSNVCEERRLGIHAVDDDAAASEINSDSSIPGLTHGSSTIRIPHIYISFDYGRPSALRSYVCIELCFRKLFCRSDKAA